MTSIVDPLTPAVYVGIFTTFTCIKRLLCSNVRKTIVSHKFLIAILTNNYKMRNNYTWDYSSTWMNKIPNYMSIK